ncbi:Rieske (2Fe-2S) protein [Bradyrhizobium sp.]|uniref:Rieske (2Fe-2S) protein n=1 Tax=Bradyrhizobium sp. TaxID=376 RepID=UPI003C5BC472
MASAPVEVFAVCSANAIERSGARSFSLSRIDESGEARPFPIVVVRSHRDEYVGYVNSCPHSGVWLNIGSGDFFTADRAFLRCGRHGAAFEIESGLCIQGPCEGKSLQPIALAVVDGEVCLCGVDLVEEAPPNPFADDAEETMDIMIHPE